MKPWERRAFNTCAFLVAATGFLYLWMKYFIQSDDPFAVVNHPWQAAMLTLHLLVSPVFILVFGIVLNSHVMKKLKATKLPNRKSGYVSLGTFAAMVLSGYLLQVITHEGLLQAVVVLHVASGAVFSVSYTAHLIISAALARRPLRAPVRELV